MMALCLACSLGITGVRAQPNLFYDQTTQGLVSWPAGQVTAEATSNIGQFIISASDGDLKLMGNSAEVVAHTNAAGQTDPDGDGDNDLIYDGPIALATNHNSDAAIVYTSFDGTNTTLSVTMVRNSSGNGMIHMAGPILKSTLPSPQLTWTNPPFGGGSTDLSDVQAAMDNRYLYITMTYWRADLTGVNQYWYAIATVGDNPSWLVSPRPIPRPIDGAPAYGLAQPTVTCNRWSYSSGNAIIGYAYVDPNSPTGRQRPATMVTDPNGGAPVSNNLIEPPLTPLSMCFWVRAVNFDNPSGASPTHYFYAYEQNKVTRTYKKHEILDVYDKKTLWSTDAATVSPVISKDLALTTYPGFDATIKADPGVGDGYIAAIPGQAATVYCDFTEYVDDVNGNRTGTGNLRICREWGNSNTIITTNPVNYDNPGFSWFQLGCNQMGVFVPFDDNGANMMWRAYRPFYGDIMENTLATGLCSVQANADQTIMGIGVGTAAKLDDTLRVLAESSISPSQTLLFIQPLTVPPAPPSTPPALWAGEHPSSNVDADPGNARGDIILDNGADVDFNGGAVANVILQARSDGSIEYNGAIFEHETNDIIGCMGETRVADTTEKRRGIWYMNNPLSLYPCSQNNNNATGGINNGSMFGGVKGQVRFAITSDNTVSYLTITGSTSSMNFDSTYMYLGYNSTNSPLTEINASTNNILADEGAPNTISFTNGLISNLWQYNGYYDVPRDFTKRPNNPGAASLWYLNGVANINISGNHILYNQFYIENPVTSVNFNSNRTENIQNLLSMIWAVNDNSTFTGQANIEGNLSMGMWPFGSGTLNDQVITFDFEGFNVTNQHLLRVDGNNLYGENDGGCPNDLYDPNSIGIQMLYGTNADVTGNQIADYGLGIYNGILGNSDALLCSNGIFVTQSSGPRGIGIIQDGTRGTGRCYVKLNGTNAMDTAFVARGRDASNLIENTFDGSELSGNPGYVGAAFQDAAQTLMDGSHGGTDNYAAFNHFENNSVAQVVIRGDANMYVQPVFGRLCHDDNDAGTFGENTFVSTNSALHIKWENWNNETYGYGLLSPLTENGWNGNITTLAICSYPVVTADPTMGHIAYSNTGDRTHGDDAFECGGGFTAHHSKDGILSVPALTLNVTDTEYLFYEAMKWDNIDPQKALDTMRLFVETYPHYKGDNSNVRALGETNSFTWEMSMYDSAGKTWVNTAKWIDNYNWLVSVYTLDTTSAFESAVLDAMGSAEIYFDRNGSANLAWNEALLFPDLAGMEYNAIAAIRQHQKEIPEDTTPFYKIPIPPLPYGANLVSPSMALGISLSAVPNPANQSMTAYINTTYSAPATLEIYNALGQRVVSLPSPRLQTGNNQFTFDCSTLPAGNYFLRLASGETVKTIRIAIEH